MKSVLYNIIIAMELSVFMLQLVDMLLFCLMQINNFRIYIISTLI